MYIYNKRNRTKAATIMINKNKLIYIYIYIYVCVCVCVCTSILYSFYKSDGVKKVYMIQFLNKKYYSN